MLVLVGDRSRWRCGRENDFLNGIEDVNKESGVDWGAKIKSVCHDVVGDGSKSKQCSRCGGGTRRLTGTMPAVTWLVSKTITYCT